METIESNLFLSKFEVYWWVWNSKNLTFHTSEWEEALDYIRTSMEQARRFKAEDIPKLEKPLELVDCLNNLWTSMGRTCWISWRKNEN